MERRQIGFLPETKALSSREGARIFYNRQPTTDSRGETKADATATYPKPSTRAISPGRRQESKLSGIKPSTLHHREGGCR